jgi:hypothetical protein
MTANDSQLARSDSRWLLAAGWRQLLAATGFLDRLRERELRARLYICVKD